MDEDLPVVQFRPRQNPDHPPLGLEPKKGWDPNVCKHKRSIINREARTLTCRDCGVLLDPIEQLWQIANYGTGLDSRIAEIREHNEKQQEAAKRKADEQRQAVPKTLASLKNGDKVRLQYVSEHESKRFSCGGDGWVISVSDTSLEIDCFGHRTTVAIENITYLRVLKRAKHG